ncbi:MAG: cytochrome P450 [Acidobacteriota bacterium]
MLNLFSDEIRRNPYTLYDQLRSTSPILYSPQGDLCMVFDYEGVKRVVNDHEAFSSKAAPSGEKPLEWLIFLDPPRHTKLRALISQAFTPRSVANLEPRIREISRNLLDQTIEHGEMDLVADFSVPLPLMVIAEMLGIPSADWPRFRHWSDVLLNLSQTVYGGEEGEMAVKEFRTASAQMNDYLVGLLDARQTASKDDLLTRLVKAEVDGERLTSEEIMGFFKLLILAGHETTTNLLNNAILCFIENQDQLTRLQTTPDLLPLAIEEVLRYRAPVQVIFRAARYDVEMHGEMIPAGKLVLGMVGSANRDPKQFQYADRFDITRNPNPHIAFGHGIHFCLGAALSRLEARIALSDLLERAKGLELASNEPWEPRKAFHVHGPTHLPIRFEPGRQIAAQA